MTIVASRDFLSRIALAQIWMSFGVQPQAMLGNSIGEFGDAVWLESSPEDALEIVATAWPYDAGFCRQAALLSVRLSAEEVNARIASETELDLQRSMASLPWSRDPLCLEQFEKKLTAQGCLAADL